MGFFDRFKGAKSEPPAPKPGGDTPAGGAGGGVMARVQAARERLEANDLPGALAIYEEVLATAGDRADVLVTLSGDLGSHGHVEPIIELVAPRYDAERHGPATGLNLLQAYLAVRNATAAQHVLDILFALNRPELEERLHGFSNAIADLMVTGHAPLPGSTTADGQAPKIGLVLFSKPIWFYGLEPLAGQVLPPKDGRLRRIAFAQLALPGYPNPEAAMKQPEDELGRLSRAIPLWLAETFYFSSAYDPAAALGIMGEKGASQPVIFPTEWTTDNFRQLVETSEGGFDYIVSGSLRLVAGDYEMTLRIWEVKKFRERKALQARWTPATANDELAKVQAELRRYMEWAPAKGGLAYAAPTQPRAWLDTLGASLGLFLVEKGLLQLPQIPSPEYDVREAAQHAATGEAAALAYLTLRSRATKVAGITPGAATLADSTTVAQAENALGLG